MKNYPKYLSTFLACLYLHCFTLQAPTFHTSSYDCTTSLFGSDYTDSLIGPICCVQHCQFCLFLTYFKEPQQGFLNGLWGKKVRFPQIIRMLSSTLMTICNGILMWIPFTSQSQIIHKGKNDAKYYWDTKS